MAAHYPQVARAIPAPVVTRTPGALLAGDLTMVPPRSARANGSEAARTAARC